MMCCCVRGRFLRKSGTGHVAGKSVTIGDLAVW